MECSMVTMTTRLGPNTSGVEHRMQLKIARIVEGRRLTRIGHSASERHSPHLTIELYCSLVCVLLPLL
jgi:hypothetical protein